MNEPPRDPFPGVTTAGRILIILTVIFSGWLFVSVVLWINDHGPASRYPIPFFLCVMAPVVAAFFGLGTLVLRLFGLSFRKQDGKEPVEPGAAPNGGPTTQSSDSKGMEGPTSLS
ncbi:MAG: hypothetical protein EOP84_04335 [Verrucomicrobiaceae bacterium]|nr:MAG: hypothetical protein EOP84_04335 [Verrucomicrobiaceae bacterium]